MQTTNMIGIDGSVVNKKNDDDPYGITAFNNNKKPTPTPQPATKQPSQPPPQQPAPTQQKPSGMLSPKDNHLIKPKQKQLDEPLFDPEVFNDDDDDDQSQPQQPAPKQVKKPNPMEGVIKKTSATGDRPASRASNLPGTRFFLT